MRTDKSDVLFSGATTVVRTFGLLASILRGGILGAICPGTGSPGILSATPIRSSGRNLLPLALLKEATGAFLGVKAIPKAAKEPRPKANALPCSAKILLIFTCKQKRLLIDPLSPNSFSYCS
jgi:hypothetical protein